MGKDDPFDGTVRDVAFVPKADVFESGEHVRAHDAGEATDLFASNGVALVRHRGTTTLLAAEWLLSFADFGALEVANFERDFFQCGGDGREGAKKLRWAATLGDRGRWEVEGFSEHEQGGFDQF